MKRPTSFRGQSGRVQVFEHVAANSGWISRPGIALFVAPNGYTWRVIRTANVRGREHDVQPLWAHADASRYGGDTVLFLDLDNPAERQAILSDLEAGLSPLWPADDLALAA